MKRGRKAFTREQLAQKLDELEKISFKTPRQIVRMGILRRRLGIYSNGKGQTRNGKLTIIRVRDYIRAGGVIETGA